MFEAFALALVIAVPIITAPAPAGEGYNSEYELMPSTYDPSPHVDGVCEAKEFACGRHSGG